MNKGFGNNQRRGRTLSLSTGIPMLDMANEMVSTSSPLVPSFPIPMPGARGKRRYCRASSSGSPVLSNSSGTSPVRSFPVTNFMFYASAKFNEFPPAASLPKPPSHWMSNRCFEASTDKFGA